MLYNKSRKYARRHRTYRGGGRKVTGNNNTTVVVVVVCAILAILALSATAAVFAGTSNYLDVELAALFYYNLLRNVYADPAVVDRPSLQDGDVTTGGGLLAYLERTGAESREKLEAKRSSEERWKMRDEIRMEAKARAVKKAATEHEYEALIHAYTNAERADLGMKPLRLSGELSAVAGLHSLDMLEGHFFDHVNPRGQSPTDRGDAFGVPYAEVCGGYYASGLAENIYYLHGYGVENAATNSRTIMDGWMASSGHRANIMNESYDSIGIGVRFDDSEIYATQVFC